MKNYQIGNKWLFMAILAVGGFSSCTNDVAEELSVNADLELATKALSVDTLNVGPIIQLEGERNIDSCMRRSSSNSLLNSNLYAMGDLRFNLIAREGPTADSKYKYLTTTGEGNALSMSNFENFRTYFYAKILPSTAGIPYLIYSNETTTPICVGAYQSNPNNKIPFALKKGVTSLMGASWDLLDANNKPGFFVIESQDYLTNGPSGSWWDVYKNVLEVKSTNSVGFGQYLSRATQEFEIKPVDQFKLKEIKYTTDYPTGIISMVEDSIMASYKNESYSVKLYDMPLEKDVKERSSFAEYKGINFGDIASGKKIKRPSVVNGQIQLLPSVNMPEDAVYEENGTISSKLSTVLPLRIQPRCLMSVVYYLKKYSMAVSYEITVEHDGREAKIRGVWRGEVYISDRDPKTIQTNIDTRNAETLKLNINTNKLNRAVL